MSEKKAGKDKKFIWKPVLIWAGVTLGVIALFAAAGIGGVYAYVRMYENKIYPGVSVLGLRLDGLSQDEARKKIQDATDIVLDKGLQFELDGEKATVDVSSDNDLPDLIIYDIDSAVSDAYAVGRDETWKKIAYDILRTRISHLNIEAKVQIDEARIKNALQEQYKLKLPAAQNATFKVVTKDGAEPEVQVVSDRDGAELVLDGVWKKIGQQAQVLDFQTINLQTQTLKAQRQTGDLKPLLDQANEWLKRPSLTLTYDGKDYPITTSTLSGWLMASEDGKQVTIDKISFASSVRALAKDVEAESKTGNLEVKDGKIVSFTAGTLGKSINMDKTLESVLTEWPASSTKIALTVDETQGQIAGEDLDQFGIKELIGVGKSNYGNSPTNRIKNIKKAVYERINGTLIAPGETFSMLKTLGAIDGEHGWLPELVIKGNKTTPEYGGGLCQVGTTMFRGAIDTGLPIVERRNHSYRVSYYEPAGTDATIYDPAPDFKFLNDTGKYIYINAYVQNGSEVVFEFWGTKDGRSIETTKPKIYNIVSPPPTKLIETLDLAPGKKQCTESAHAGADAEFSTTVTYADGQARSETFNSHYRPWQAVCLIGVEKLSDAAASSTSE